MKAGTGAAAALLLWILTLPLPAHADTIEAALVRAYQTNPQLGAQRAFVRSTDENVPQALAGYRPQVGVTVMGGYEYGDSAQSTFGLTFDAAGATKTITGTATATQTLYNGNQTANKVRGAESQVLGAREGLRVLEQTVLLSAATVYMDYLRDAAIVEVNRSNVRVLDQTLKQTDDRFRLGELSRTDVAQSQAQLAAGKTQLIAAESTLTTTQANFRRIVGNEPQALAPASPVDRFLPRSLPGAVELSLIENPNVTAAKYGIDVNFLKVKVNEGALLPTVTLQASVQQAYQTTVSSPRTLTAAAVAQANIPVYQGGAEYSLIRQSKETLEQQRLTLEQTRDQTRASTASAWGQLEAAKSQISSAQSQVTAAEFAFKGVREEALVGQRTTIDVLNAQQALVNARIALVTAQHDRVVGSYSVLSAVGRLSPHVLGLATTTYDPSVHYHQVRDKWIGVRTPDGH